MTRPLRALALFPLLFPGVVFAQDVVVTPGPGGGFVVEDDTGTFERLRVDEQTGNLSREGQVFLHAVDSNVFLGVGAGTLGTGTGSNTAVGNLAFGSNVSGAGNSAFGQHALGENTSGGSNSAFGGGAMDFNTTGSDNSAFGVDALQSNTTGNFNAAFGVLSLTVATTAERNAAFGYQAAAQTATSDNAAFGYRALGINSTGTRNSAFGSTALDSSAVASDSSAFGYEALTQSTGSANSAFGASALAATTDGFENVGVGKSALAVNMGGDRNVAIGTSALSGIQNGNSNIAIGYIAGSTLTDGSNDVYIANFGPLGAESNTIRIGNNIHTSTLIGGIFGSTSSSGVAVFVNSSGKLGTATSSALFKQDVHDMGARSDVLMKLRPVTFRYREEVSEDAQLVQYGLIAEEVASVDPGLVAYDENGKPHSVRYQFLAPMLLNEAQHQRRVIETQRKQIEDLTERLERLERLEARLASQSVASQ